MKVLNLTTKEHSPCFQNQVRALERRGVDCTNVAVPGYVEGAGSRSVIDYMLFYPKELKHLFGSYDLVHANYGLTAPFALAQPILPVVLSLWGSDLEGRFGWLSKLCAPHCDATVVMSESMGDQLDCEYSVIPHGVELDRFEPLNRKTAIERVGWDPDTRHVLFPYSPSREVKNYPRAERIVDAVAEQLAGSIKLETLGGVEHSEMSNYMNAADCLLLTSRREGSPNVVKEALACNLPVVSTDVGDVAERLDGVEPSAVSRTDEGLTDAVVEILRRGERSNGREHAREISSEQMAERLRSVYQTVVDADERSSGAK